MLDPRLIYFIADLLHHTESSNSKQFIGKYDIFIAPQLPAPTTSKLAHVQLGDNRSIVLTLREWTSCKHIHCGLFQYDNLIANGYTPVADIEEASSAVIAAIVKGERERVRSIVCDSEHTERVRFFNLR